MEDHFNASHDDSDLANDNYFSTDEVPSDRAEDTTTKRTDGKVNIIRNDAIPISEEIVFSSSEKKIKSNPQSLQSTNHYDNNKDGTYLPLDQSPSSSQSSFTYSTFCVNHVKDEQGELKNPQGDVIIGCAVDLGTAISLGNSPTQRQYNFDEHCVEMDTDTFLFSPSIDLSPVELIDRKVEDVTTPPPTQHHTSLSPPPFTFSLNDQLEEQPTYQTINNVNNKVNHEVLFSHHELQPMMNVGSYTSAETLCSHREPRSQLPHQQPMKHRPPRIPGTGFRLSTSTGGGIRGTAAAVPSSGTRHRHSNSMSDTSCVSTLTEPEFDISNKMPNNNGRRSDENSTSMTASTLHVANHIRSSSLPTSLIRNLVRHDSKDQNLMQMPGMPMPGMVMLNPRDVTLEIPESIMQPILTDDEENEYDAGAAQQTFQSGIRQNTKSPTLMESTFETTENDIVNDKGQTVLQHHQRLAKLGEYEDEAQAILLSAIEEELNRTNGFDVVNALFPDIPDEARDNFRSSTTNVEGTVPADVTNRGTRIDDARSKLTFARMQWLAFQRTVNDEVEELESTASKQSVVIRGNQRESINIPKPAGTAEGLVRDAGTLMSVLVQNSCRKRASTRVASESFDVSGPFSENNPNTASRLSCRVHSQTGSEFEQEETPQEDIEAGIKENFTIKNTLMEAANTAVHLPTQFRTKFYQNWKQLQSDFDAFVDCTRAQQNSIKAYIRKMVLYLIGPSLAVSFILFHLVGNPHTGYTSDFQADYDPSKASISWWFLFIGVRHPIILMLAMASEYYFVTFLGVSSPRFMKLTGPYIGLLITQGKGWPGILFFWGIYSFMLAFGNSDFANNWASSWESGFRLFSEENPSGDVTSRSNYFSALWSAIIVGSLVSAKRLVMGFQLGRRLYARYNKHLTALMERMLLLSEIASLSVGSDTPKESVHLRYSVGADGGERPTYSLQQPKVVSSFDFSLKNEIMNVLEEWEEPAIIGKEHEVASIADILEFRQAYELMQTRYPFSIWFGRADTRDACVKSAKKVFEKLLLRQSRLGIETVDNRLDFNMLCEIAVNPDGTTNRDKIHSLRNLLLPDRQGFLSLVDFTKNVDTVYRDWRTLSANVRNASAVDLAFEKLLNVGFYFILSVVLLEAFGVNAFGFILSFWTILAAFTFALGPACSLCLEGILMILVRKPYEIGDRIALSDPSVDTNPGGSNGWIVEDIGLFSTTVRYGMTREVASHNNGAIARFRIINMNRSEKATVMIHLKFGVDVPYQKVKIFRNAVEKFVNERPREWLKAFGFRATRVEIDLGFIEYVIVLQSRESWQNPAFVLEGRAAVSSFCLELQKQMGMVYRSPPMPVEINMNGTSKMLIGDNFQQPDPNNDSTTGARQASPSHPFMDSMKTNETMQDRVFEALQMFETKKTR